MAELERLIKVPLREFWEGEASDFTPWLADEENIGLLGDTIGVELEVEAQEKNVGPFRADILCKEISINEETSTEKWVLIENQLERTDHTHLGQLLTYAAGLEAVTVVWIAESFTDEHRAALDWLNEITAERVRFFGLEIELWRIRDSPMAPKFNVVSYPNNWQKTVDQIVHRKLTSSQQLYLQYWTALCDLLKQRKSVINPGLPSKDYWLYCGIDCPNFWFSASASVRHKWICISLTMAGKDGKSHFYLLERGKVDIEKEIGNPLEWDVKHGRKQNYISLSLEDTDPEDHQDWNRQHQWLCEQLEAFHRVFSPRVKTLDVNDYIPDENETAE